MGCIFMGNWEGECTLWEHGSALNPEAADEDNGACRADGDDDMSWCQSYEYNRDGSEEGEEDDE